MSEPIKTELQKAIEVLIDALKEDKSEGSYYFGWQSNIACAFMDEFNKQHKQREKFTKWLMLENGVTEISNNAAKNFLYMLIYITDKNETHE